MRTVPGILRSPGPNNLYSKLYSHNYDFYLLLKKKITSSRKLKLPGAFQ